MRSSQIRGATNSIMRKHGIAMNTMHPKWYVNGHRYDHAATRYWMALFDEVCERYPEHTAVELSTTSALPLDRDLLNPAASLERMLQTPPPSRSLAELLKELEWTGPPAGIRIAVYQGKDLCLEGRISTEVADAETFMYLVAWLLEWAKIPTFQWNAESVRGDFRAEAPPYGHIYDAAFSLHTETLDEEMMKYTLSMKCSSHPA